MAPGTYSVKMTAGSAAPVQYTFVVKPDPRADATEADLVEQTLITARVIGVCGDDTDIAKQALVEVEKAATLAQPAICEARSLLSARLDSTRRFCDTVKERAGTELGKLEQQLQDAQDKLDPCLDLFENLLQDG